MLRILLVEDNGADARLTSEMLKETGMEHELVWFNEGGKALERIRSDPDIGLFIVDLNLPGASGVDVVAQIRKIERYRTTPVIIMTGSRSFGDKAVSIGGTPLHYIIKPMTIDEMDRTTLEIKNIIKRK